MENLNSPEAQKIRGMFASLASTYDRTNTTLSAGLHHLWRKKLLQLSEAGGGDAILDCATGTGDLALAFKKQVGDYGKVVGVDFTPEMLELARVKAEKNKLLIDFQMADVTALPFANDSFHISSIAFGIRNVHDPVTALREMARVTRPGGKVMILEFGQAMIPVWKQTFNLYAQVLLPKIGGMLSGQEEAYRYLQSSSAKFPCAEAFSHLLHETQCFSHVSYKRLSGGVAYIYEARVK